jgi:uncharacterized membrane protein YdfJ with MMPL/SSD domain
VAAHARLLFLAFGTLVAAGLPLLLTMAGLLGTGGLLFLAGGSPTSRSGP